VALDGLLAGGVGVDAVGQVEVRVTGDAFEHERNEQGAMAGGDAWEDGGKLGLVLGTHVGRGEHAGDDELGVRALAADGGEDGVEVILGGGGGQAAEGIVAAEGDHEDIDRLAENPCGAAAAAGGGVAADTGIDNAPGKALGAEAVLEEGEPALGAIEPVGSGEGIAECKKGRRRGSLGRSQMGEGDGEDEGGDEAEKPGGHGAGNMARGRPCGKPQRRAAGQSAPLPHARARRPPPPPRVGGLSGGLPRLSIARGRGGAGTAGRLAREAGCPRDLSLAVGGASHEPHAEVLNWAGLGPLSFAPSALPAGTAGRLALGARACEGGGMEQTQLREVVLEVAGLTKVYRSGGQPLTVLEAASFAVVAGETLAIVGPSGSGKTTLLGLCAGLDLATAGTVKLLGEDLGTLSEDARARVRNEGVGFVFQNFQLLPTLTALENVMVPLELRGTGGALRRARALLDAVGLADRGGHYPAQLSGGEQQRVALARAFINDPKVLFADEPTGNLDAGTRDHVIELLFDLNRAAGTTLILVTHDTGLAKLTGRRLRIERGRLREEGRDAA